MIISGLPDNILSNKMPMNIDSHDKAANQDIVFLDIKAPQRLNKKNKEITEKFNNCFLFIPDLYKKRKIVSQPGLCSRLYLSFITRISFHCLFIDANAQCLNASSVGKYPYLIIFIGTIMIIIRNVKKYNKEKLLSFIVFNGEIKLLYATIFLC